MRGGTSPRGYTIVEVMIFLAVSGFMFVIAAAFVSGKQSRAEFRQGMNDINTQVQQVINDVSNGFYPSNSNFSCQANSSGALVFGGSNVSQGTNSGCIFLGKVIQFKVQDTSGIVHPAAYNILTVAGRQYTGDPTTLPPGSFTQAFPAAVSPSVDLTQSKTVEWGVQVTGMYDGTISKPIGAVGFFGSFANNSSGSLESGSQTTQAIAIPNSSLGQTESQAVSEIANGSGLDSAVLAEPNPNIIVCFNGGAGQYGSLTIGGINGQRLTTNMQIGTNPIQFGSSPAETCPAS